MKKCKYCQSEIDSKAKICPNCRKKQKKLPWWAIVLIIIIVIGVISSLGSSDTPEGSSTDTTSNNSRTETKKQENKKEFNQNETVTYKNVKYTITNVEKYTARNYDEAKDGQEFVTVHIKIENNSDSTIDYNSYDWKMQNSNGQLDDVAFTIADSDTALHSGQLISGGSKEGTLTFEEPIGDSSLKLTYYENIIYKDFAFQINLD